MADLQRVDMGIAMCHFELAARERGLAGRWVVEQPRSRRAYRPPLWAESLESTTSAGSARGDAHR